jgi:hypothetical protein
MPNQLDVAALNAALARIPIGGSTVEIHAEVKRLSLGAEALIALHEMSLSYSKQRQDRLGRNRWTNRQESPIDPRSMRSSSPDQVQTNE